MEVRGVEPLSVSDPFSALHAYPVNLFNLALPDRQGKHQAILKSFSESGPGLRHRDLVWVDPRDPAAQALAGLRALGWFLGS